MIRDWQTVRLPLFAGLDTKASEIAIAPPKVRSIYNGYADKTGRVRKRKGITTIGVTELDGGTATTGTIPAMARYKDAALLFGEPTTAAKAWEYSQGAARWIEKGYAWTGRVDSRDVAQGNDEYGIYRADMCSYNGVTLYAHAENDAGTNDVSLRVTIYDAQGTCICHRVPIYTSAGGSIALLRLRAIAYQNYLHVYYYDAAATDLMVWICNASSVSSLSAATIAGITPVSVAGNPDPALPIFDVAYNFSYGIFLAYRDSGAAITYGIVNPSTGAMGTTATIAPVAAPIVISCAVASNSSQHGIAYGAQTAPNDVYAALRSWNGSAWSVTATSAAIDGAITAVTGLIKNIACRFDSTTTLRIYYTADNIPLAASLDTAREKCIQSTYTTGGVATARVVVTRRAVLASKPFQAADGEVYLWVFVGNRPATVGVPNPSNKQCTHFLIRGSSGEPVAWANQGVAGQTYDYDVSSVCTLPGTVSASEHWATALFRATRVINGRINFGTGAATGLRGVFWDQTHGQQFQSVEVGDSLYLTGGYLQQYDGNAFVESGFLRYVETDLIQPAPGAGGALTPGTTYYYRVIPEWENSRGEKEYGTDSGAFSVTLGGAQNQVTLTMPNIPMTRRGRAYPLGNAQIGHIRFGVYRTIATASTADAAFYRVGSVENQYAGADDVVFVDQVSDANADDCPQLYLVGGELDHVAPPAGHIATTVAGRVFMAGFGDDPNLVRFSLLRATGDALAFADENTIQVPDFGGEIVALAAMNEALIIFKQRAIYRVRGEGPNNLGQGSFLEPELISSDTGCTGQRSVVTSPAGVMFQSPKGLYLLTQGFQLDYIGAPVEAFGASTAVGAVLLAKEQQIRVSTGSYWLIYDYYHRVWSVYEGFIPAGPAIELDDLCWYAATTVYREDGGAISSREMSLIMAPLKIPEEYRLRRVGITGEVLTGEPITTASISLFRNYEDLGGASAAQTITLPSLSLGPVLSSARVSSGLIAEAMTIVVSDGGTTAGELCINEIVCEVGVRQRAANRARG